MADVFISYARSADTHAKRIAELLRAQGYTVWSDEHLPAHRAYAEVIEEQINAAKAVLVIWSADAVRSEWVRSEANRARECHKLVQIAVEPVLPPMPFDQIHCADLSHWEGTRDHPGWRKVTQALATLAVEEPRNNAKTPEQSLPETPGKPSVGVAPFVNLSDDRAQDYFVDGLTDDVIAALTRFRTISVIAAGSIPSPRTAVAGALEVGRSVGVRYLLEGSVRKAGDHVRIVLRLTEMNGGAEVWTDRIDEKLEEVFVLQDRVALQVASAIEPAVKEAEMRRISSRTAGRLGSYDLYLRSSALLRAWTKGETLEALELLQQSINLEPQFAAALAMAARAHARVVRWDWGDNPDAHVSQACEQVAQALRFGGDDAYVLAQAANALPDLDNSNDRALGMIERSLRLNPGSAYGWLVSGWINVRLGASATAFKHLDRAERLEPFSTVGDGARAWMGIARFQEGRLEDALQLFSRANIRNPDCIAVLGALYGCVGQIEKARQTLRAYTRITDVPVLDRVSQIFTDPEQRALFTKGICAVQW